MCARLPDLTYRCPSCVSEMGGRCVGHEGRMGLARSTGLARAAQWMGAVSRLGTYPRVATSAPRLGLLDPPSSLGDLAEEGADRVAGGVRCLVADLEHRAA